MSTSLWQTPQACTLMRTCPAPGLGISRSTISKSCSRFRNLRDLHLRRCHWYDSSRCHKSSYEVSAIVEKHLRLPPRRANIACGDLTPPPRKSLPARPGCRAEGLRRHTPGGKDSCLFRRRLAATPKRRQRLSADRGHLPKWPPTRRAERSRVTLSSDPKCCRATARTLSAAR